MKNNTDELTKQLTEDIVDQYQIVHRRRLLLHIGTTEDGWTDFDFLESSLP